LVACVRRVEARGNCLDTYDGKNLLPAPSVPRTSAHLRRRKDGKVYDGAARSRRYSLGEEKTLAKAIDQG